MAVGSHGNQIALFAFGGPDDLRGGITQGEAGGDLEALGAQLRSRLFQVPAVVYHLLRFGQFEPLEIAGHPAIGDVHQQQLRAKPFGQRGDVRHQDLVRETVFKCDQNFAVHVRLSSTSTLSAATPAICRTGI